jgi:hypothetical protein
MVRSGLQFMASLWLNTKGEGRREGVWEFSVDQGVSSFSVVHVLVSLITGSVGSGLVYESCL